MHDISHCIRFLYLLDEVIGSILRSISQLHDIFSSKDDERSKLEWVGVLDLAYVDTIDGTHGEELEH
jgi:hypothetical protein